MMRNGHSSPRESTRSCNVVGSESDCKSRGRDFDPEWSQTFVEIDHKIISTVTLLLPLIQEGLLSVASESMCTKCWLTLSQACPGKSVVR